MNWTSFRSDFNVGWKKIKTNIQNSTLNSSFAALLKWHDAHIRQENEQLLEKLKNFKKGTEDIKQQTKEKLEEANRLKRKRRLDEAAIYILSTLRPRTTPKKYKFWSWRTELKWISNKKVNFLYSYPRPFNLHGLENQGLLQTLEKFHLLQT